jgi:hypothetical protein
LNQGLEPKLPLIYGKNDGPYQMITAKTEMIHQNLKNLMLTNPGERVMDPRFGIGIKAYLFETDNSFDVSLLIQQVQSQVSRYIPGIRVVNIAIKKTSDHEFYINLIYNLLVQSNRSNMSFDFKVTI